MYNIIHIFYLYKNYINNLYKYFKNFEIKSKIFFTYALHNNINKNELLPRK